MHLQMSSAKLLRPQWVRVSFHGTPTCSVPLHSPMQRQAICLPLGLCKGDYQGHLKNSENCKLPRIQRNWGLPVYIDINQSHNRQHQPNGGHVSYPTHSPTATKLRLCYSLPTCVAIASNETIWTNTWRHTILEHTRPKVMARIAFAPIVIIIWKVMQCFTAQRSSI